MNHCSEPACRDACITNADCVAYTFDTNNQPGTCKLYGKEAAAGDPTSNQAYETCFIAERKPIQCLRKDITMEGNFIVTPNSDGGL